MLFLGLAHWLTGDLLQALVARQSEEEMDLVFFLRVAPGDQLLAAEAGVGAEDDPHLRLPGTQRSYESPDLVERALGRVLVGRAQPRAEQLVAGEEIQRQVAVAVLVAVEKALRLMAVSRDVCRVEIVRANRRLQEACDSI